MKETLGYRLKRERTLRQLSQEALAKALATDETPINKSMISRWERDLDTPSTKNLTRLAEYFRRPLEYFTCAENVAPEGLGPALVHAREKQGRSRAEIADSVRLYEEDLARYEAGEPISETVLKDLAFRLPGEEMFTILLDAESAIGKDPHDAFLRAMAKPKADNTITYAELREHFLRVQLKNQLQEQRNNPALHEIPLIDEAVFTNPDALKSAALFQVEADVKETITLSIDTGATFCLRAPDDAMAAAGIRTDDLVFVKKQLIMDDGEIAVVLVPGDDGAATRLLVRRVYHTPGSTQLQLTADDPSFPPLLVDLFENGGAKIIGKVTYTLTQPH